VKKYVIDTNALISFVTDRNLEQQKTVTPLFESATRMKSVLICHQFVLTEFVFVMERIYKVPKETINTMLRDLISTTGIELQQQTDFSQLLNFWPAKIPDFGDALVAATAKGIKGSIVVTFDERFRTALNKLGIECF
jgi:predicted nucleic-acid-binding protein